MGVKDNIQWNGWTVISLLGEGQYGKVYKIARSEFGRTYESALKVIRIPPNESEYRSIKSEGLDEESITAYYQSIVEEIVSECDLMYELKGNSNIVSYEGHQVQQTEDSLGWEIYIQMELLTPVVKYMSDHKFSEFDTIRLGIDICKALEICTQYNIIHRDIKPENIFISKQGNYKLGDFGVARRIEDATVGMSKKGTISYMAPEIYHSKPYNATVDTYSLGIMMYRLVNNNRAPFLPPYPEKITFSDKEKSNQLRMTGKPLPLPSEASDALSQIILKACAFDPKDRYQTPTEMRVALETLTNQAVHDNIEHVVVVPCVEDSLTDKGHQWLDDDEPEELTLPMEEISGIGEELTQPYEENTLPLHTLEETNMELGLIENKPGAEEEEDKEDKAPAWQRDYDHNESKSKTRKKGLIVAGVIVVIFAFIVVAVPGLFSQGDNLEEQEQEEEYPYQNGDDVTYISISQQGLSMDIPYDWEGEPGSEYIGHEAVELLTGEEYVYRYYYGAGVNMLVEIERCGWNDDQLSEMMYADGAEQTRDNHVDADKSSDDSNLSFIDTGDVEISGKTCYWYQYKLENNNLVSTGSIPELYTVYYIPIDGEKQLTAVTLVYAEDSNADMYEEIGQHIVSSITID